MFGQSVQETPTILFHEMADGVYLLNRPAESLAPFKHYSALFAGDRARYLGYPHSVVVEQTYPGMRVDKAENTGVWNLVGPSEARI